MCSPVDVPPRLLLTCFRGNDPPQREHTLSPHGSANEQSSRGRSSDHNLPDLVADLQGQIDVELVGGIDTGKGGRIRNTFDVVLDAPVSKFILRMQGGNKGLIVNSRNLCASKNHANARFDAHNGRIRDFRPLGRPNCKKAGKRKRK